MGIAIKERRDWDAACAPSFNLIHPRRKAVGVFRLKCRALLYHSQTQASHCVRPVYLNILQLSCRAPRDTAEPHECGND